MPLKASGLGPREKRWGVNFEIIRFTDWIKLFYLSSEPIMQTQIVPVDGEKPTVVVVAAAAPIVVVQQDIANSMDYVAFQNLNNVNSLEFKQGKVNTTLF